MGPFCHLQQVLSFLIIVWVSCLSLCPIVLGLQHHQLTPPPSPSLPPLAAVMNRRQAFARASSTAAVVASLTLGGAAFLGRPQRVDALVTDETDNFADNWWSSSPSLSSPSGSKSTSSSTLPPPPSDEIVITVSAEDLQGNKQGLGLELSDVEFRTNRRVFVKSILPGSLAEKLGIRKDWIVVSVNGQSAERTDAEGVAIMVYRAATATTAATKGGKEKDVAVELRFRDPTIFQKQLRNLSTADDEAVVTTQVAPAGDTTQRRLDGSVKLGRSVTEQTDQRLSVSQLVPPKLCNRGAQSDDLLEISYVGKVVETDQIFDGSAIKINGEGIPGRADDVSIFFVLGKQPFGQFPPGWDVGLQGQCVGERRRIIVPPALAYGSTGLPRRNIPPDATLQYDVTVVSLNGLATPQ